MKVMAVLRAERFSPNSEEKDRAIMMAVTTRLKNAGHEVTVVGEESLTQDYFSTARRPQTVLTMGRLHQTLQLLSAAEQNGVSVINSTTGIGRCSRSTLARIMKETGIPTPPSKGSNGYWVKRGDSAAQTADDVQYAADEQQLDAVTKQFMRRGISNYTVEAHVVGDVVKFYGVRGTAFFRYYYPTDDGDQKFGDEKRNGAAHHYRFDANSLQLSAQTLAEAVGISVYGGDCIVRADGEYCIIDFNDWPSFARCREEAAEAIAGLITNR